jgi:hypothetical protein
MTSAAVVARVWHAEPEAVSVRCAPMIGKPHLSWAETMGAGDGNRTRMTSLEGSGGGSAERRRCRSAGIGCARE